MTPSGLLHIDIHTQWRKATGLQTCKNIRATSGRNFRLAKTSAQRREGIADLQKRPRNVGKELQTAKTSAQRREGIADLQKHPRNVGKELQTCKNIRAMSGRNYKFFTSFNETSLLTMA